MTGDLERREEDGVIRKLRCPSFEFRREFIDENSWRTEELIEGDEFVGVIRLRPLWIEDGKSGVEEFDAKAMEGGGV